MSIQADNGSPHYPKRIGDVVIKKRGNSFVADLQNSSYDTLVWGPMSDTEGQALRALGEKVQAFSERMSEEADWLKSIEAP